MRLKSIVGRMGVCAVLIAAPAAMGAGSLNSIVEITASDYEEGVFEQADVEPYVQRTDNGVLALDQTFNFAGMNGSGSQQTMAYHVVSNVQSDYGVMRASFNTTLSNVIHNAANPKWDKGTGSGVPDSVGGQSNSEFIDSVAVTGGSGLSQVRVGLHLDGSLSQTGSYPFGAGVADIFQGSNGSYSTISGSTVSSEPGGSESIDVLSRPIPVVNGKVDLDFILQVYSEWEIATDVQYIPDGSTVSDVLDFFNTAQITGIEGLDSSDNVVPLTSATGDSGMQYPVNLPEPMGVALVGLIWLAGRKRGVRG